MCNFQGCSAKLFSFLKWRTKFSELSKEGYSVVFGPDDLQHGDGVLREQRLSRTALVVAVEIKAQLTAAKK